LNEFIAGKENIKQDFLSRIEAIDFSTTIDYDSLQIHHESDPELQHLVTPS